MPARRIRQSTWKRRVPTCGRRHRDIEEVGGLNRHRTGDVGQRGKGMLPDDAGQKKTVRKRPPRPIGLVDVHRQRAHRPVGVDFSCDG